MNEVEKENYLERVDRWTAESYPRLQALADSWQSVPVKDFDEGLTLCTAIRKALPFIEQVQQFEARKALRIMNGYLTEIRRVSGLFKVQHRTADDTKRYKAVIPAPAPTDENGTPMEQPVFELPDIDGRRPDDLKAYHDQLPEPLQQLTAGMKEEYLALAEYRGRLDALCADPNSAQDDRARFAEQSLAQENKIRDIWARVDEFWKARRDMRSAGVPDKVATEIAADRVKEPEPVGNPSTMRWMEIERFTDPSRRDIAQKMRVANARKYISSGQFKPSEKSVANLRGCIEDLMHWGEDIPVRAYDKCAEAAIVIPGFNDNGREPETAGGDKEEGV